MVISHQLEREDKRKSLTITIIAHALLLLLGLLPFLVQRVETADYSRAITIDFSDSSTRQSGQAAAAASSESSSAAPQEQQTPREQIAVAAVSSLEPTASTMPVPARSIQMSSPTPDIVLPSARTSSPSADRFFEQPLEVNERHEVDRVEAFKAKPNPAMQQKVTWHVSESPSSEKGTPSSFDFGNAQNTGSGKGSGQGKSGSAPDGQSEDRGFDPFADGSFPDGKGTGKGDPGKNTGAGADGKGMNYGDFAGDGLFTRKVIKRAPIERIADLPGKIVINLCVDQLGKVVFAQFDSPNSTIRSKQLATQAEAYAKMYVFEEDPSAPREQCGRLTFIFEIKK